VSRLAGLGWRARIALREGVAMAYQDFLSRQNFQLPVGG